MCCKQKISRHCFNILFKYEYVCKCISHSAIGEMTKKDQNPKYFQSVKGEKCLMFDSELIYKHYYVNESSFQITIK